MQAAVGVAQLDKIDYFTEKRRSNFSRIYNGLEKFSDKLILPIATQKSEPSWFCFPISVKDNAGFSRDEMTSFLGSKNIDCRNFFAGNLTRHPAYLNKPMRKVNDLPNSDYVMNNTFFIGVYPGIGEQEIDYVLENFGKFMESH
jgi:CDP-6-deoxy-D-xylo-4-hexulose-3-dehydrase